jgi:hypothetical protein
MTGIASSVVGAMLRLGAAGSEDGSIEEDALADDAAAGSLEAASLDGASEELGSAELGSVELASEDGCSDVMSGAAIELGSGEASEDGGG